MCVVNQYCLVFFSRGSIPAFFWRKMPCCCGCRRVNLTPLAKDTVQNPSACRNQTVCTNIHMAHIHEECIISNTSKLCTLTYQPRKAKHDHTCMCTPILDHICICTPILDNTCICTPFLDHTCTCTQDLCAYYSHILLRAHTNVISTQYTKCMYIQMSMHVHAYNMYAYTYHTTSAAGAKKEASRSQIRGPNMGRVRPVCAARSKPSDYASWHCRYACKHWSRSQPRCGACSKPRVYDA
jgi:hypothetical protein